MYLFYFYCEIFKSFLDDFESCISLAWDPINSDVLYSTSSNQLISKFDLRGKIKIFFRLTFIKFNLFYILKLVLNLY